MRRPKIGSRRRRLRGGDGETDRSSRKSPDLLGVGSYGCVFKGDSLPCTRDSVDDGYTVKKLMFIDEARDEMEKSLFLKKIDPSQKYFLYPKRMCDPVIDEYTEEVIEGCELRTPETRESVQLEPSDLDEMMTLVMVNGGQELAELIAGPWTGTSDVIKKDVINFWKVNIYNLLTGIKMLRDSGFVHHDIKANNILYDEVTKVARYIDFGISIKMSSLKADSRRSRNDRANKFHFNMPIEYQIINKDIFDEFQSMSPKEINQWIADIIKKSNAKKAKKPYNYYNLFADDTNIDRIAYLREFEEFLRNILPTIKYDQFLNEVLKKFDLFSLCICMMSTLLVSQNKVPSEWYDKASRVLWMGLDPNVFVRSSVEDVIKGLREIDGLLS